MTKNCKVVHTPNRLGSLLSRPGGITREHAVKRAAHCVETLRERSEAAIWKELAQLKQMWSSVAESLSEGQSAEKLEELRSQSATILNLAGTFGHDRLASVLKSLCELATAMTERESYGAEPIAVHMRALALFSSPHGSALPQQQADNVLGELRKVVAHIRREASSAL